MKEVKVLYALLQGPNDVFRLDLSYIPKKICIKNICWYSGGNPDSVAGGVELPMVIKSPIFNFDIVVFDNKIIQYCDLKWDNTGMTNFNNWFNITVYHNGGAPEYSGGVVIYFEFTKPDPMLSFK